MSAERAELLKKVEEGHVNYVDVLLLALAYTKMPEFVGYLQQGKWYQAVHEIVQQFGELVPLLKDIFFEPMPKGLVYSEKVEHWLDVLSMAGLIDKFEHAPWRMSETQRSHIIAGRAEKLREFEAEIQEMAEIFRRFLKP